MSGVDLRHRTNKVLKHWMLMVFAFVSTAPVALVVINSFKGRRAIFKNPYHLPNAETFDLVGYETVFAKSQFHIYYFNSLFVTLTALALILLFGTMVAFALAEYTFPGNNLLRLFSLLGIIIPIRLGSDSLLRLIVSLDLIGTLWALIVVYIAGGLPLAVFILTQFMAQAPSELKDAARVDGASEYRVFWLIVPIIRPATGTVSAISIIPMWNDLWFPLVLAPGEATRTVTLGAQQFMGQFSNDWNALLAALSLSSVPVLVIYFISSKQLLQGLTAGAIKN
ncbi:MAG: carbohydrate ABC transporter permease [Chloroflexota bacterium]|nr:carbohydrate ABC transporter permease [Chloroflexota bacterium]MDE2909502.1 carbohydrate ABC transporter permease [Chloroflexota bacterium]